MSFVLIPILGNLTAFIISSMTIIYIWHLKRMRAIKWLICLFLCYLITSLFTTSIYLTNSYDAKVESFYLRILGMLFMAPCWLLFTSAVFDRFKWLHKKWVVIFLLFPCLINFILVAYPGTRSMLFTDLVEFNFLGSSTIDYNHGPWYKYFYVWSVFLFMISYVLSMITFFKEKGFRRNQVIIINTGLAVGLLQNIFSDYYQISKPVDLIFGSTFAVLFTQLAIIYAVLRHRLLSIVPLAMFKVFNKFPDPVIIIDDRNKLLAANQKAFNVFNLSPSFQNESIEKLHPNFLLKAGELIINEDHYHLAIENVGEDLNNPAGKILFFRDISVQKRNESYLNEILDFKVQLLALLSHDLTGFIENQASMILTLQKTITPEQRLQFDLLTKSTLISQDLVSNLLTWVKNQTSDLEPVKKSFEWNILIKEVLEQMEGRALIKDIKIAYQTSTDRIIGYGDSEMLASVLRNFLANSINACENGKQITLQLELNQKEVMMKISDEGPGIAPEKLAKIMKLTEEFVIENSSKESGAGLGLMIARQFIKLHGGTFHMHSELGQGTIVSFRVPL